MTVGEQKESYVLVKLRKKRHWLRELVFDEIGAVRDEDLKVFYERAEVDEGQKKRFMAHRCCFGLAVSGLVTVLELETLCIR